MKRFIRWWMVLVLGLLIAAGLGAWLFKSRVVPEKKRITDAQTEIDACEREIANKPQYEQQKAQAEQNKLRATLEVEWYRQNRMPRASGNPFWRVHRNGYAFRPVGTTLHYGSNALTESLSAQESLRIDYQYEMREDLPMLVYDFVTAAGCSLQDPVTFSGTGTDSAGPVTLSASVVVDGGFDNVLNLFRRLGEFPRLLAVNGMELSPIAESGGVLVTARFNLEVYEFPDIDAAHLQAAGPSAAGGGGGMGGMGGGMGGMGGMGGGMGGMGGGMGGAPGTIGMPGGTGR